MKLDALLTLLSKPDAYPERVAEVRVIHTHISVVFLTPKHAYKIKKPVNLGFLDFSTLDKRRHFCEQEVYLNRRLAPDVYLGVVPVSAAGFEKAGEPVEWAVKMRRLPDEATLQKRLLRDELDLQTVRNLAHRLAAFHAVAARGPEIATIGRFESVAGNARENFAQAGAAPGTAVHPIVFERLRFLTEQWLSELKPLIERRAQQGITCDTHGDLHLDHIYLFPDQAPPHDLVIVDCIEFNERFRFADPLADAAFVAMDLKYHGRRDLAGTFSAAYLEAVAAPSPDRAATDGGEGISSLFRFYSAYRAIVRAKVEGIKANEPEVPMDERERALWRSRGHWLLALVELEQSDRFPCLVLIAGLPGTGKSTLARALCENGRFQLLQSDQIRKEVAGPLRGEGIYTPEWNARTYSECLRRAEELLFQGKAVVVDANFREDAKRQTFLECALRWGVPALLVICRSDDDIARQRLAARQADISDADWAVRQRVASLWEELGPISRCFAVTMKSNGSQEELAAQARSEIDRLAL